MAEIFHMTQETIPAKPTLRARWQALRESDLWYSFRSHPSAIFAACLLALVALSAILAPVISPQDPYDLAALELWNAEIPPIWEDGGQWPYLLGTDTQGRDILSAILYGSRISLVIGFASVPVALACVQHWVWQSKV